MGPAYLLLSVITFLAVLFAFVGYHARQIQLQSNVCQMTYNVREKTEIALCGKRCDYSLWKVTNARSRMLNKQPVLFIPGHLGSADQARSLSSYMHNADDYFQYFALDFSPANGGHSAFHGSDILAQASIVNEALKKIRDLYSNAGSTISTELLLDDAALAGPARVPRPGLDAQELEEPPLGIMLVGHSLGGFVARTAMLLTNHPAEPCLVRDIVQFSSPNTGPPYSPDASLDILYHSVNKAWVESLLNRTLVSTHPSSSSTLKSSSKAAATGSVGVDVDGRCGSREFIDLTAGDVATDGDGSGSATGRRRRHLPVGSVTTRFDCASKCIANARVLSISGGDIDMQVPATLSKLHNLYPVRLPPGFDLDHHNGSNPRSGSSTSSSTNELKATSSNGFFMDRARSIVSKAVGFVGKNVVGSVLSLLRSSGPSAEVSGSGDAGKEAAAGVVPVADQTSSAAAVVEDAESSVAAAAAAASASATAGAATATLGEAREDMDAFHVESAASLDGGVKATNSDVVSVLEVDVSLTSGEGSPIISSTHASAAFANASSDTLSSSNATDLLHSGNISSEGASMSSETGAPVVQAQDGGGIVLFSSTGRRVMLGADLPVHTVRASQLKGVGFPIDHAAVLWCYQLLHVVSDSMRRLSASTHASPLDFKWSDAVPISKRSYALLRASQQATGTASPSANSTFSDASSTSNSGNATILSAAKKHMYSPSSPAFRLDSRAQEAFFDQAAALDSEFVWSKWVEKYGSVVAYVLAAAYTYVMEHLLKIFACYLLVNCLALAVAVVRRLCGHACVPGVTGATAGSDSSRPLALQPLTNWSVMLPWVLSAADLWFPGMVWSALQLPRTSSSPSLEQLPPPEMVKQGLLLLVAAKVLFDLVFGFSVFPQRYLHYFYWLVSFALALLLRATLLLLVQVCREIGRTTARLLRSVLRWTIWCRPIRRGVRAAWKTLDKLAQQHVPHYNKNMQLMKTSALPFVPIVLWVTIYLITAERRIEIGNLLGGSLYTASILAVVVYVGLLAGVVASVVYAPFSAVDSPEEHMVQAELTLLYIPVVLLAYPTFWFSYRLLFTPVGPYLYAAQAYGLFATDRTIYCAIAAAVGVHIWASRFNIGMLRGVSAQRWLVDLAGPRVLDTVADAYPDVILNAAAATTTATDSSIASINSSAAGGATTAGTASSEKGSCVHEDGGKDAVFELVQPEEHEASDADQQVSLSTGVTLGSTYRVVSCACAKDYSLKDYSEWCEWCLCRKCGGKNLPASFHHSSSGGVSGARGRPLFRSSVEASAALLYEAVDISSDVILPVALVIVAALSCSVLEVRPHRYLYLAGVVAATCFVGHFLRPRRR